MENTEKNNDIIDVRRILAEWMSKWYWFVISVIVCIGLAFLYTKIKKPEYLVKANIVISQNDKSGMVGMSDITDLFGSNGKVDDEVFVVSSHSVLKQVAENLELHKNRLVRDGFLKNHIAYKEFPVEIYPSDANMADTLSTAIVFKLKVDKKENVSITAKAKKKKIAEVEDKKFPVTVKTPYGDFVFNKTSCFVAGKPLKTTITFLSYDAVAEDLAEDVNVSIASKKSNVIKMDMKTVDVDFSRAVLDEMVKVYNQRGINERNAEGMKTLEFIDSRLDILSNDLATSEEDVETYKKQHRIVDVAAEATYQTTKKAKLENELIASETEFEILKMTDEFLSDPNNKYELIPTTVATASVKDAINNYNGLIVRRMNLARTAKDGNISLKMLNEQIDAVRENILTSLARTIDQQKVELGELRSQFGGTSAKLGNIPTQEREYRSIQRKQSIKEQLYIFLLKRREETAMLIANATPKGIIVDEAYALQEPVSMKKKIVLLIALMLGLIIPPVLIAIKNFLRNKFSDKEELERHTSIPVLGEICTDRSGDHLVVKPGVTSSVAELFRLVRANLQFVLSGHGDKVVLMTSTMSGEGKSFITINLAASLALLGKRVLVIGADIRKPRLLEYLSLPAHKGLTEFLSNPAMTIDQLVIKRGESVPFDLIVAGPVPPNPAELLLSTRFDDLIATLRDDYDYILIDSAPLGMVSDTYTLARLSDATIYVCRANYTSLSDIKFVNNVYSQDKLKKLSLVVNGTSTRKGYGYGYGEKKNK